ncbi:MAG TPA: hypothetical protein PK079_03150 [Leptospiraceae bacterium]|nr:hypothetical protein [Leptospiraceae bacterium]HMW04411.1 hypothetical protein [Leptospiraceae bacterium]HMX31539.1 hypothetical protein [Leptospiraceae bacterium]HMY30597.1 hypothetical protein [Leptospiraceae bacterium]HMZ64462.1 hypothetical protein [Leptospiraceae bacterium]
MKKLIILTILFCSQVIFSEEQNKELNTQKKYSLTIKSAHFSYLPTEYLDYRERNTLGSNSASFLHNNRTKTNPLSFSYYSKDLNLFFEYSYYKISLNNLFYTKTEFLESSPGQLRPFFLGYTLPTITRRENKLNAYKKYSVNDRNHFFFGLGIRNIFKEVSSNLYSNERYIRTDTYGMEIFLKYRLDFLSSFAFNLTFEPFYTAGKYITKDFPYNNSINKKVYLFPIVNDSFVYFWGYDADINLSYRIDDNLSFFFGYNYIRTATRVQNRYQDNVSNSYYIFDSNGLRYFNQRDSYEKTDDNIQNYYVGIKAEF